MSMAINEWINIICGDLPVLSEFLRVIYLSIPFFFFFGFEYISKDLMEMEKVIEKECFEEPI